MENWSTKKKIEKKNFNRKRKYIIQMDDYKFNYNKINFRKYRFEF